MKINRKQDICLFLITFCMCNILHFTIQSNEIDYLAEGLETIPPSITSTNVTALMKAVMNRDISQVQALLNQKVNVNAQDSEGNTALHYAVSRRIFCISGPCKRHKKHGGMKRHNPLQRQQRQKQNIDIIKLLLTNGADKTIKNKAGQTPLDLAQAMKQKMKNPKRPKQSQHRLQRIDAIIGALA